MNFNTQPKQIQEETIYRISHTLSDRGNQEEDGQREFNRVLNFADDTVLYNGRKTSQQLEIAFNAELKNVDRYFIENELVLNLKAGKTELMIFGTRKNLNKNGSTLNLEINGKLINATTEYRYLGTVLDQTLSMNHHFISLYKKMSAKLHLLLSLKSNLTNNAITKIYVGMLLPTLLYCCTTNLNLTNGQQNKLQSLDRRIAKVTETSSTNYE
ncbi:uncharacterized protein LOC130641589 [Hydractinia symbiolongicarpus]|uniref:uncharacterized protein LOC130641589 n=1 Tax=Hydractinia symbiolongicarpus TaxID=13093 RepID=UPI00255123B9|nr:uncharacterized protein LOC130641589 [Hydractinia symbiolongicarpus]